MATIKILGDSFTVVSTLKVAEVKTLEKYAPKALKLISEDDKKSEIFGVGFNANGGSINKIGVTFNGESEDGLAYLTQPIKTDAKTAEAKQAAVMDAIGFATLSLKKVEDKAAEALTEIQTNITAVKAGITVVD